MDNNTKDWLEGQYLKASMVEENDTIEFVEAIGLVENTFGKKKFEAKILYDGKEKILSMSPKQYNQIMNAEGNPQAKTFTIKKKAFGNTFVLDFTPMIPEKTA